MKSTLKREIKITVYADSLLDNEGFNNCDPKSNGEYNFLTQAINADDLVLDIGANCGDWSQQALARGAKVIAFEPVPHEFEELKKINNTNFTAYNFAINDRDGMETFYVCTKPLERGGSSLFRHHAHWDKITTPTRSLDTFIEEQQFNHIDFVKIDTEGAEANILYGSKNTLIAQKISCIQFEYGGTYPDANKTLKEVYFYLTELEYKIYRIVKGGLIYINKWHEELENNRYSNYVAFAHYITIRQA